MRPRHQKSSTRAIQLALFLAFLAIAAFFLLEEHRAHMLGALPYVLGFAGMLFCMLGHRHAGSGHTHDDGQGGAR